MRTPPAAKGGLLIAALPLIVALLPDLPAAEGAGKRVRFHDDFTTNTLKGYAVRGDVRWGEDTRRSRIVRAGRIGV